MVLSIGKQFEPCYILKVNFPAQPQLSAKGCLPKKRNYVDRETVPIPSYPPTIKTVSEYLDREYW